MEAYSDIHTFGSLHRGHPPRRVTTDRTKEQVADDHAKERIADDHTEEGASPPPTNDRVSVSTETSIG